MMNNPFKLFTDMLKQPLAIIIWVGILMGVNLAAFAFLEHKISIWIVAIFMIQAGFMMALYAKFGYSKIVGASHVLWIPLVAYLIMTVGNYSGTFQTYLWVLIVINGISIVLDMNDVRQFFKKR